MENSGRAMVFSFSGLASAGIEASAPTGGPLGMSPPTAQAPPAGLNGARIGQRPGGRKRYRKPVPEDAFPAPDGRARAASCAVRIAVSAARANVFRSAK